MAETWISMPELTALIGADMAKTLCNLRGGTPMYVPATASAGHTLAGIIGTRNMELLCAEFPGMYITVPNGRKQEPRKGEIMSRLEEGRSHAAIALELGVTERYVRMVASCVPVARQLTLPL